LKLQLPTTQDSKPSEEPSVSNLQDAIAELDIKVPAANESQNTSSKTLDLLDLWLDAKDTVNNWCVARIIDHDLATNRIFIHFDGWSSRYDQVSA